VGDNFCAWLPHVGGLGLKVVGIMLQNDTLLNLLDSKVKANCDVQVGNWHLARMQADVVLVDGVASSDVLNLAQQSGTRLILSTQRKRCSNRATPSEWTQVGRERISHSFVGGVTERVVDLSIYQPTGAVALHLGPVEEGCSARG
jgi:hypothetical protein